MWAVRLDVTDSEAARAVVAAFGRLDVVVNNAGYANTVAIEDITDADFASRSTVGGFSEVLAQDVAPSTTPGRRRRPARSRT